MLLSPGNAYGNAFGLPVCLCVSVTVCPVRALTFEKLDLELLLLVRMYILRIPMSCTYTKVIGSMSRSQDQIGRTNVTN